MHRILHRLARLLAFLQLVSCVVRVLLRLATAERSSRPLTFFAAVGKCAKGLPFGACSGEWGSASTHSAGGSPPFKPFGKVDPFSHRSQELLGESQAWPLEKTTPLSLLGSVVFLGAIRSPKSEFRGVGTEAISQVPGRTKQSIQVLRINIRQLRRPGRAPAWIGPAGVAFPAGPPESADRRGRILAARFALGCPGRRFGRSTGSERVLGRQNRLVPRLCLCENASIERRVPGVLGER